MNKTTILILSGAAIGLLALLLGSNGNPPNMGVCVACFMRDVAGAMKLHNAAPVQYMRPEIFGFALGAFLAALAFREYRPSAGSSPLLRFTIGFLIMIGCLVFLGCPLRMILRIGGGDLNAVIGLFGFVTGIGIGALFLKQDFALPPSKSQSRIEGSLFPLTCALLLMLTVAAGGLFATSTSGPGSQHAPLLLALVAGLIIGGIVQRTRFCFIGMANHIFLFRRWSMALGVLALLAVVMIGNLWLGNFKPGFAGQPIAHSDGLWNFLSMLLVGLCGAFVSGCPLRQIVGAGQGNGDAALCVLGMFFGAAAAHNFGLASSAAGPTTAGKTVVIVGIVFALLIGVAYSRLSGKKTLAEGVVAEEQPQEAA